jgi:undecaprenyl-diphosphatase
MSDAFRAIVLGIVEGITEFLPISSTGHMILVEPLLGIPEKDPFWSGTFDIFIQIGAILAVLLYFWRRLWRLVMADSPRIWGDHILTKIFVAFLPAAVVGLLAGDFIEEKLKTATVVAGALVMGGVIIILIERSKRHQRFDNAGRIPMRCALLIGVAQCFAMIPGTSRSAATIMGALLLGLTPAAAAEFSFFLAIPTMLAAGGYSLLKHLKDIQHDQFVILGLGFSIAFVVALLVVAAFMRFIQTHRFTSFAIYRIVLGLFVFMMLRSVANH